MVYLSLQNAVNAYNEIQGKVKNRFWGLIAFTYSCDKIVESAVQYSVDLSKGANLLENIFRFNEVGKFANTSTWYFTLSNNWISKGFDLFFSEKVDIFDIIIWCYRKVEFVEELDSQSLLEKFVNDFHFPREAINEWFNINLNHRFIFESNCPSDTEILSKLSIDNRNPFTLTTDKGKTQVVVANACDLSRAPFVQTLYSGLSISGCILISQFDLKKYYTINNMKNDIVTDSRQQIFYGAPGTGKSHKIKKYFDDNSISTDNIFRTTFHPDSDYSTFVGAYKPTMQPVPKDYQNVQGRLKEITYQFIPQAFLQAYIRAYQTTDNVYLVIEEINRGNCAQIFGDLFQLLDRDENGKSEYNIKADTDLCEFLKKELGEDSEGIKDGELCLPPNLYIWATMNTSDQSLFPIDSAFKRRWDWEYMPIGYNNNLEIQIGDYKYSWTEFQRKINDKIYGIDNSEDKKLGDFFVNPHDGIITSEMFLNKILFYLWNDVCKDEPETIFGLNPPQGKQRFTFSDFFYSDKEERLNEFMKYNKISPKGKEQNGSEPQTEQSVQESNANE